MSILDKNYFEQVYKIINGKKYKYNVRYIREDFTDFQNEFNKVWSNKCMDYNFQPSILPKKDRIIVMGDIHGDWDLTIELFKLANLIDDNMNWIGKDTVVVQVGDQIDRCRFNGIDCSDINATKDDEASDIKILHFFTKLHNMAQKDGGAVYSLIGNHELMNVMGKMDYVSYKGRKEFENYDAPSEYKTGEEKRRWAFKQGNEISNFLGCTRHLAIKIGSNLFVHAGILPDVANKYSIEELNRLLKLYLWNKLENKEKYNDIFYSNNSPLWNREIGGIAYKKYGINTQHINTKELTCIDILSPMEKIYKVGKIFVGHTPIINNGISHICDEKIWLTDVAGSKAFDNTAPKVHTRKAQVLEILNDNIINVLKK